MIRTTLTTLALGATVAAQGLPPVPQPAQNPITAEKAVLGKMLFWEEQLSSDDTISCGTCHQPNVGGTDPIIGTHPGLDRLLNTQDDIRASNGVVDHDAAGNFRPNAIFGFREQVTDRSAQSSLTSQYSRHQFWDGRADEVFRDPLTNQVVIPRGGSLETQALMPIMSTVEMAIEGRTWGDVISKLQGATPMALATNLPADIAAELASEPDYPELFQRAFGDPTITPVRIAFALATYERTLIGNQTPFDMGTLNAQEQRGLNAFRRSRCDTCHREPFFTDHQFRNIGVRPIAEDNGRQGVTNNFADRGKFKVPSLRNVGLKRTFMHQGRFTSLRQVLDFYAGRIPGFNENRDPLFGQIRGPRGQDVADIDAFIRNGLTDPRVRNQLPPFDRPTLRSQRAPNRVRGFGSFGSGGRMPMMMNHQPAFVGAQDFKVGLRDVLGNAPSALLLSAGSGSYSLPFPVLVDLNSAVAVPIMTQGNGPVNGYATWKMPIANNPSLRGFTLHAQWLVADAGAAATGGIAASQAYEFTVE